MSRSRGTLDCRDGLRAIVLGSAAGGGVPQWNCGCHVCTLARSGNGQVRSRTQASVAVSADGQNWMLVGASPDLRQQIEATPALWPDGTERNSPIFAVTLVSADIDGIAGLLTLREAQPFRVIAPAPILDTIAANTVFGVLDPSLVAQTPLVPGVRLTCDHGLHVTLLVMPGKVPLYLEDRTAALPARAAAYAALIEAHGRRILVAPACAEITESVRVAVAEADIVFFDGTLFTDDEMIAAGVSRKTGRRMGHAPLSGPDGTLARLADVPARRILLHINNTNPVLIENSPERHSAERAGFEVAHDGMEVCLWTG
ncbi:MAG: pyrroloquinoline quinone biosynthesis protein PqqB [Acetobacteraceae bacterium]